LIVSKINSLQDLDSFVLGNAMMDINFNINIGNFTEAIDYFRELKERADYYETIVKRHLPLYYIEREKKDE
jgi:hypothetical protein